MTVSWEYEPFHYPPKPVLPNLYSSVSRKQRGDRLLKENYLKKKKKIGSLKQNSKGEHLHWRLQVNLAGVAQCHRWGTIQQNSPCSLQEMKLA